MKKQKLILISFFFLLFNINHLLSSDQNYLLISGKPKITAASTTAHCPARMGGKHAQLRN